jgi:hypothetical protein
MINRNSGLYVCRKNVTVGEFAILEAETFQSLIPSTPHTRRSTFQFRLPFFCVQSRAQRLCLHSERCQETKQATAAALLQPWGKERAVIHVLTYVDKGEWRYSSTILNLDTKRECRLLISESNFDGVTTGYFDRNYLCFLSIWMYVTAVILQIFA